MGSFLKCRIAGLIVFSIAGFHIGEALAPHTELTTEQAALVFLALGAFAGLIAAPWLTIIPLRHWRRAASELTVPQLMLAILGGLVGLTAGLMLAFPLSLLSDPLGMALRLSSFRSYWVISA